MAISGEWPKMEKLLSLTPVEILRANQEVFCILQKLNKGGYIAWFIGKKREPGLDCDFLVQPWKNVDFHIPLCIAMNQETARRARIVDDYIIVVHPEEDLEISIIDSLDDRRQKWLTANMPTNSPHP